ncbi:M56 family metallopeptidase [Roseivirga pacifica]|uniref:M56 family metallopeptidase n=1 Tax=Roseivirga pacifica TaxID=1267423 RepID=UPI0020948375|nr:M56 family metallopeptidase [Roseivirga pacifica]MCO6357161.1 TonB family protein [Roseivirga pacifica]MCO6368125.1 TonB family protein [Roseivirga pacifica]MCO6369393.1 TonB family protein [Roseivirga pacifica]MCO6373247.1 TonB family protein [Roseivirga pacifica]MCO6377496.1 TonB family protein [Roseivirga pacifica]
MKKHPTIELLESLNGALIYALEAVTCLAIFYLFYHFFLRKEKHFHFNRVFLLGALVLSFTFPLLEIDYNPANTPSVLNSIHAVGNEVSSEPIIEAEKAYSYTITAKSQRPFLLWWEALLILYIIGTFLGGLKLFIQLRQFKDAIWYKRHATRFKDSYFLVNTDGTLPTFAFFNYLFWDNTAELSETEQAQIIAHEQAHIKQKHSYDIILVEVLKIIFWFNPLMYLYKMLLEEVHEYAADRSVAKNNGTGAYSKVLVQIVFKRMGLELASHFNKNQVVKRIEMLEKPFHKNWAKFLLPIPIAALLFFIFSFEAVLDTSKVSVKEFEIETASQLVLEQSPEPAIGVSDWSDFLEQNIVYPQEAKKAGIEGDVELSFSVTPQGRIEGLTFDKKLGHGIELSIIEALRKSSVWKPAVVNGQATTAKVSLPISFKKA